LELVERREKLEHIHDMLCVIQRGAVAQNGKVFTKGTSFGADMILEDRNLRQHLSTVALTYAEIALMSKPALEPILEQYPEVHKSVACAACKMAFQRFMVLFVREVKINKMEFACHAHRSLAFPEGSVGEIIDAYVSTDRGDTVDARILLQSLIVNGGVEQPFAVFASLLPANRKAVTLTMRYRAPPNEVLHRYYKPCHYLVSLDPSIIHNGHDPMGAVEGEAGEVVVDLQGSVLSGAFPRRSVRPTGWMPGPSLESVLSTLESMSHNFENRFVEMQQRMIQMEHRVGPSLPPPPAERPILRNRTVTEPRSTWTPSVKPATLVMASCCGKATGKSITRRTASKRGEF